MDDQLKEQFIKAIVSSKKMLLIAMASTGISFSELGILMHISQLSKTDLSNPGVRVTKIKEQTHISLPAVSQQLRALQKKGLISRSNMPDDLRITLVFLTPSGKDVLNKVKKLTDEMLEKIILKVGEENINQYIFLSHNITEALEEFPCEKHKCEPPDFSLN